MRLLADAKKVADLIQHLGEAVGRQIRGGDRRPLALVGIRSRGDLLAQRLARIVKPNHLGTLDLTLYRDDLSEIGPQAVVRTTDINFNVDGVNIVLIDDVIMTGRSVRAALQSLMDLGRPQRVWLLVLVDRGGRELPIVPDHVGLRAELGGNELVNVFLRPTDDRDAIEVSDRSALKGDQYG